MDKSQVLLAEVFKLLENSDYGKPIELLESQTCVIYKKDERVVDRAPPRAYFSDLEELEQAYELGGRKSRITINRAFQIEISLYQLAKQRMLEFLDRYFDRHDFELIQVDMDGSYTISASWA